MVKHKNKEKARLKTNTQQHPVKLRIGILKYTSGAQMHLATYGEKRNGMEWNGMEWNRME
jgi:hypothetical protein